MSDKKKSTAASLDKKADYIMDLFRHIESSDKSGMRASKTVKDENGEEKRVYASTGYGYYQITKAALDEVNAIIKAEGGQPLTLNTREEQHEAMRRLLGIYDRFLKNDLGINDPTPVDYYGVHFSGKAGYKKLYQSDRNASTSSVYKNDAIEANKGLLKDKKNKDVFSAFEKKVKEAVTAVKKQSSSRVAALQKEKKGYDLGLKTPVDLRAGSYKGDGAESWDRNDMYNNGRRIGEHKLDYVVDIKDGAAEVIKKGSKSKSLLQGNYKVDDYDYSDNFYDPTIDKEYDLGIKNPNVDKTAYSLGEASNYRGNKGFIARPEEIGNLGNPQSKEVNYKTMSDPEIAKYASMLYANEKAPHTAQGNQELMMGVDQNGNPVSTDTGANVISSSMNQAQDLNAMNNMINAARRKQQPQQQFKLGGDMKDLQRTNQESNDGLVTFNEGGTHEENPLGGIPQNTNPDGSVNTVEEGETKHQGYVFSDSIRILPKEAEELMLPEEVEGMTYAEASEYLNKALVEHEFDPIVKRTVEKQLENLKAGNEKARLEMEANNLSQQQYDSELAMEQEQGDTGMSPEEAAMMEQQGGSPEGMGETGLGSEQLPSTGESVQPSPQGDFQLDPAMMQPQQGNEHLIENPDLPNQQFKLGGNIHQFYDGGNLGGYNINQNLMNGGNPNFLSNPTTTSDFSLDTSTDVGAGAGGGFDASGALSKVGSVATGGMSMMNMLNTKDAVKRGEKINKGSMALQGAAAGATMGSVAGPWGTAIGAVVGGATGLIAGGRAAKKAEKQRVLLDEAEARNLTNDFRTGSGQIEGDTKEFAGGGDLFDNNFSLYDKPFTPARQLGNIFIPKDLSLHNNDFSIPSYERNADVGYDPRNNSNELNYSLNRHNEYLGEPDKGYMPPKFKMPDFKMDDNPLRYASIAGSYDNMRRWDSKTPWRESYTASGERFEPEYIDRDSMIRPVVESGNTAMRALQDSAGGNASAARANILAGQSDTQRAISEMAFKIAEYNNELQARANQTNNNILAQRDAAYNKEMEANMANAQTEYNFRESTRNSLWKALTALGKEREMINQSKNVTKYDRFGNRV